MFVLLIGPYRAGCFVFNTIFMQPHDMKKEKKCYGKKDERRKVIDRYFY